LLIFHPVPSGQKYKILPSLKEEKSYTVFKESNHEKVIPEHRVY
jgi:hypothetical protein